MHKSVEQFSVKTIEIGGLGAALQALRLPYGKDARSEVFFSMDNISEDLELMYHTAIVVDKRDISLLKSLVINGDEHAKVLRGVMVWCVINAPRYWWQEESTYRIGAEGLGSESTMHIEGKGLSEDELVEMKEKIEESHMQKRVIMYSYQTLRRIYFQRRNHKLPQWRLFCDWIKSLPYAEEFITIEKHSL